MSIKSFALEILVAIMNEAVFNHSLTATTWIADHHDFDDPEPFGNGFVDEA